MVLHLDMLFLRRTTPATTWVEWIRLSQLAASITEPHASTSQKYISISHPSNILSCLTLVFCTATVVSNLAQPMAFHRSSLESASWLKVLVLKHLLPEMVQVYLKMILSTAPLCVFFSNVRILWQTLKQRQRFNLLHHLFVHHNPTWDLVKSTETVLAPIR